MRLGDARVESTGCERGPEPVAARDFLRFLLDWQRVTPETQMEGPAAVDAVVGQLEGFEAAASAWEGEILPARIDGYESAWLDDRCMAGQVVWTRLRPRSAPSSLVCAPGRFVRCRVWSPAALASDRRRFYR